MFFSSMYNCISNFKKKNEKISFVNLCIHYKMVSLSTECYSLNAKVQLLSPIMLRQSVRASCEVYFVV